MNKAKQNKPSARPCCPGREANYRRCRHSVFIRINGEEYELYCEDLGDSNYKPPGYRFAPCKCGMMDVVVGNQHQGMRCAKCGASRGCPNCDEGPGHWREFGSWIECGACGAHYGPPSVRAGSAQDHPEQEMKNTRSEDYETKVIGALSEYFEAKARLSHAEEWLHRVFHRFVRVMEDDAEILAEAGPLEMPPSEKKDTPPALHKLDEIKRKIREAVNRRD